MSKIKYNGVTYTLPEHIDFVRLCCTKRADLRWNLETSQALELNLR